MPERWRTQTTQVQSTVIDACWRPAEGDVGGDFHSFVDLLDGRLVVLLGDAVGLGFSASAIADQLRNALRPAVVESDDPAVVLALLESALVGDETIATAVCGVLDPAARTLHLCNAGHLPGLSLDDGEAEFMVLIVEPPLGVPTRRATSSHRLVPSAPVVFYTDGLIERRGTPLDVALRELRELAVGLPVAAAPLELCRRAVDRFGVPVDDVTVMSIRANDATSPARPDRVRT